MRFHKITIAFAAVALVALGTSTSQAGDHWMKGAPTNRAGASAEMLAQGGQESDGSCMQTMKQDAEKPGTKMRTEERGDCCLKHRMEREDRRHERHMERGCCCCCCCGGMRGMGERTGGHRMSKMGGPEMKGWKSFSTVSLDEWLGIETGPSDRGDLTVTKVLPNSPAEKAGIQPQDILTSVNGVPLLADQRETLASLIQRGFADGKTVTVTALRAGKVIPIEVTLRAPAGRVPAPPNRMEMGH
jgi:hypothetical protein